MPECIPQLPCIAPETEEGFSCYCVKGMLTYFYCVKPGPFEFLETSNSTIARRFIMAIFFLI